MQLFYAFYLKNVSANITNLKILYSSLTFMELYATKENIY